MKNHKQLLKSIMAGVLVLGPVALDACCAGVQTVQVRGIEHVGLNVPDLDAAIKFFSTTFGFSVVTEMHDLPIDSSFKKLFHMHDSASVKRIVMMRAGNGANIELFQYDTPEGTKEEPFYDDAGEGHVAFYTDDMNESVAALREMGVKVLTDPIVMTEGPTGGEIWTYFLTPWGSKLELVSYPNGEAYEKQGGSTRLWTPLMKVTPRSISVTPELVQSLAKRYLALFNEQDATKRLAGINEVYTGDTTLLDPDGVFTGPVALNDFITDLQKKNPGWCFRQVGKASLSAGSALVNWQFGPASDPGKVGGADVLLLRDSKIASTIVFLGPAK